VVVFYGSQTGTAEEFAGRLAKDASRYGMKAIVADPEESDMVSGLFSYFYSHPLCLMECVIVLSTVRVSYCSKICLLMN